MNSEQTNKTIFTYKLCSSNVLILFSVHLYILEIMWNLMKIIEKPHFLAVLVTLVAEYHIIGKKEETQTLDLQMPYLFHNTSFKRVYIF